MGAAYFDSFLYSQGNLARLLEALRQKPARPALAQQRVYEVFSFIDLLCMNMLSVITHDT